MSDESASKSIIFTSVSDFAAPGILCFFGLFSITRYPKMAEGNSSMDKHSKRRSSSCNRTLTEIAAGFVTRDEGKSFCRIDSKSACKYMQENYNIGNFVRHFQSQHAEKAYEVGLLKEYTPAEKKTKGDRKTSDSHRQSAAPRFRDKIGDISPAATFMFRVGRTAPTSRPHSCCCWMQDKSEEHEGAFEKHRR